MEIAAVCKVIRQDDGTWSVPSQSGNGRYTVNTGDDSHCTCPDHETRKCKCKHIYAVEFVIKREVNDDGTETITKTVTMTESVTRKTYPQDWPAYNAAQTNEKLMFQSLMFDLCGNIEDAPQANGRPRLPLSDAVFAIAFKVYSTVSQRRFICDLNDAHERGFISDVPHFNSISNYLDNPEITPVLRELIEISSLPLKAVETDFAADSSGFTSSRFVRWFDHKYGAVKQEHTWVKCHIMCGVKTNVVTAVEIHDRNASDMLLLPSLADATAKNFAMREVSADKGYSSMKNVEHIAKLGATPFIAYKSNTTGRGSGFWSKMFHYFNFNREEFLDHYHKRSNVESTFSMIKAKFRDHVRGKNEVAMKNEVLCKILCHNICCLISAFYELGIEPDFATPVAQKVGNLHNKLLRN
jgi:transposase